MKRKSMTTFKCIVCEYGSLVRSNFKLNCDGDVFCRNEDACKIREIENRKFKKSWNKPYIMEIENVS